MEAVSGNRRGKRAAVVSWLLILSLFVAELFFYTWCRVQSMKISYEISRAMGRQKELVKLEKDLTIELALLRAPHRLSEMAKKQFDLKMPAPEQVVTIP